jgi:hypothetical protein
MAKFVRKHPDASGTYQACFREKNGVPEHISIVGRQVYETDDKKEIEFLRIDPEVIEVSGKTRIENVGDSALDEDE